MWFYSHMVCCLVNYVVCLAKLFTKARYNSWEGLSGLPRDFPGKVVFFYPSIRKI